jgi:hypothetical protein
MTNKQSNLDGTLSDEEIKWLVRRAKGGFAITTTAAANVTEHGRGWEGEMGVWGDHQLPGLTELAKQLNETGTVSLAKSFTVACVLHNHLTVFSLSQQVRIPRMEWMACTLEN